MAQILLACVRGPSGFRRPVVIKRILPHLAHQQNFVAMFLDEARIVAGIRHPNVIHVEELGEAEGELFLTMEYLEGESVSGLMRRLISLGETLPPRIGAHIVAEACAGLHAAHELTGDDGAPRGLVHRDVSPHNLFVTYDGHVKVLDFGIALVRDRAARTEAGQVKGKFRYMSPEQCKNAALDRRSDVFSLGIVLYELTTGCVLFQRDSDLETLTAIANEPVLPPSRIVEEYPMGLEPVCLRALEIDPASRYARASDMRADILRALASDGQLDGTDALATLMQRVFAERIAEKGDIVARIRKGSTIDHVPVAETDVTIEMKSVHVAMSEGPPREPRRPRRAPVAYTVAAVVAIAAAVAMFRMVAPGARVMTDGPIRETALPADAMAPLPSVSAHPMPDMVNLTVETKPSGATVLVDGVERGLSPMDVRVPRGDGALRIQVHRRGHAPQLQSVRPTHDQHVFLSLLPVKTPRAVTPVPSAPEAPGFRRFD